MINAPFIYIKLGSTRSISHNQVGYFTTTRDGEAAQVSLCKEFMTNDAVA
jgi:hypothetical protein